MTKRITKLIIVFFLIILCINVAFAATRIYRVQETDFVKINVEATDPDKDPISYTFSEPLDDKGEWQTDLGDAGEYLVNITASDGEKEAVQGVKIIVSEINKAPLVKEKKIFVKENEAVDLTTLVSDPNDDPLNLLFNFPFDKKGKWTPSYDDEGSFIATFIMDDGEFKVPARVEVIVEHSNQPPTISSYSVSEELKEGQTLTFSVDAVDNDGDKVEYTWTFDDEQISYDSEGTYSLDYDSSGKHVLKVVVNDGNSSSTKEWEYDVENTNRKPSLSQDSVTVNEGQKVALNLPEKDQDGDVLSYTYEDPFNSDGEWQTGYFDSGSSSVKVIYSDGEFTDELFIDVEVLDVDRKPSLTLPEKIDVWEGEALQWELNITDPDNDDLTVTFEGAPESSLYYSNQQMFTWEPDFSELKRKGGMISNILNSLRVEHWFINNKKIPITVKVCGKEVCSTGKTTLFVHNVNRAPVFDDYEMKLGKETEEFTLTLNANDPDGDIVHYYFTEPLDRTTGKWDPDYGDAATYEIYVTATDGKKGTTVPVPIKITKNNRVPSITVNDDVAVREGQYFSLQVKGSDEDGDNLTISLANPPKGSSFKDSVFSWEAPHDYVANKTDGFWNNLISKSKYLTRKLSKDKEVTWLEFKASDGEAETIHPVKLAVKNVNVAPEIADYSPNMTFTATVGEPVVFYVLGNDFDNDELTYEWKFGLRQGKVTGTNAIERTFVAPGEKKVMVVVDDGRESVAHEWTVKVVEDYQSSYVSVPNVATFKTYIIES